MSNWIHRLFNPHCPHCVSDRVCQSCETLKMEMERLRIENTMLLSKILEEKVVETERKVAEPMKEMPRNVPWRVRQQMLEQEDRERAKLIKQAPKPDNSIEDLEKELNIVERNREDGAKQTGKPN